MDKTGTNTSRRRSSRRGRAVASRPPSIGKWIAIAVGLVLVVGIGAMLVSRSRATDIPGLQTFSGLSREHTSEPVAYAQNPPVGGMHYPSWQNCGVYNHPIQNETAVHSLEHGAVWITYRPDLPADAVEQLRALVRGHSHALLSPYEGLPSPVVASAWGVQLQVEGASDDRLGQFLSAYERGPQTPEPGATCSGGIGTPTG